MSDGLSRVHYWVGNRHGHNDANYARSLKRHSRIYLPISSVLAEAMLFDEPATLEPDDILAWYELCSEGLERERQDTHRRLSLREEMPSHLSDILPIGATQSEIDDYFSSCQEELDLSAVLTLAASAEARIRLDAALRRKTCTPNW
jgi:hypothetical protein